VRPLGVVHLTPRIERLLRIDQVAEAAVAQDLGRQRTMETLVLPLRLRMIRTAVDDRDPQSHQPRRQTRPRLIGHVTPRRSVVHQHPPGQTRMPEHLDQFALHHFCPFVVAGPQPDRVARVIVQHRQRMTPTAASHRKVSLEIHLP